MNTGYWSTLAVAMLALGAFAISFRLSVNDVARDDQPRTINAVNQAVTETPTTNPYYPDLDPADIYRPLLSEEDAVDVALEHFAETSSISPTYTIAKLVSFPTYLSWSGGLVSVDGDTNTPIWLVGVLAQGLTEADTSVGFWSTDDTPVQGAYYAFRARSGFIQESGSLIDQTANSEQTLSALQNEALTIDPLTEFPTPRPTPTEYP